MISGNVAFEINETAKGLGLFYEPRFPWLGYQPIRVDLGK
jgi:hypothetical protein